ncbi:MAG: potassium/hydrogen antiporter [Gaiellaceae bacterium]|nr:potassium/hydrogen antiporter [Gaiellaceae bacterium]
MSELVSFGAVVLVVATGFSLALLTSRISERLSLPGPAIFLLAAAVASDLVPRLGHELSPREIERVVTVALILILFDGGMHVGLRRFRSAAAPIISLGLLGTFLTAGALALAARGIFGLSWTTAALIGAALAPTDPAAVFSVLGKREIEGRSSTILEGESGANDPVGIALMLALLASVGPGDASVWHASFEFVLSLAVGTAVGIAGGLGLRALLQRVPMPTESLDPLRTLALAGVIYGLASVLHGSGFLAVFAAGILVGDLPSAAKPGVERFHASLASLAEIVAFVALGLSVQLGALGWDWARGLVLALVLALVVRPLVVGPLLLPIRLSRAERIFVLWGGLKGAVPILLGTLVLLADVPDARRIYGLVFVVVAFSVVVQGTTLPWLAARTGLTPRED